MKTWGGYRRPRSSRAAAVALLVVGAVLAGCARVPDGGPAVPVADPGLAQSTEPETTGVNTGLPKPGDDARESADAYLTALRTTRNPGPLGDNFVAAGVRRQFARDPDVVVVREPRSSVDYSPQGDVAIARFTGVLIGTVDSEGIFEQSGETGWEVSVRMERKGNVWLFAEPPPLVVEEPDFASKFTQVTVYFLAASGTLTGKSPRLVVPEQRYVNNDVGGTATQVVDFVLGGPSETLNRVTRNPLPRIRRTSQVLIDGSDLVIELEPAAESANVDDLNAFVAEVGWSLSTMFTGRVRLLVAGRPLNVRGFNSTQPPSTWRRYNPAAVEHPLPDYRLQNGGIVRSETTPETAPRGPSLAKPVVRTAVRSAAVSRDLSRIAVVRPDPAGGERLWISDASGTMQPTLRRSSIGRPSWGGYPATVVVPVGGRLFEVGVGNAGDPIEITVTGEGRRLLDVTAVRISLDGVRALIVTGAGAASRLWVGTLTGPTAVGGDLSMVAQPLAVGGSPRDVAWFGPVQAAVAVVTPRGPVAVVFTPIDGSPVSTQTVGLSAADPIRLGADPTVNPVPDVPLEVGGRLYGLSQNGGRSTSVAGSAPFFPG